MGENVELEDLFERFRADEAGYEAEILRVLRKRNVDPMFRARARHRVAWYYLNEGRAAEALPMLKKVLEEFDDLGEGERRLRAAVDYCRALKLIRRYRDLLSVVDAFLSEDDIDERREQVAHLWYERAVALFHLGRYLESTESLARAEWYADERRPDLQFSFLTLRGYLLESVGAHDEALEVYERADAIAADLQSPQHLTTSSWSLSLFHFGRGNYEEARIQLERYRSLNRSRWKEDNRSIARVYDILIDVKMGASPAEYIEELVAIEQSLALTLPKALRAVVDGALAECALASGRYEEACTWASRCAAGHEDNGDHRPLVGAYDLLARCQLAVGNTAEAHAAMRRRFELLHSAAIEERRRLLAVRPDGIDVAAKRTESGRVARELATTLARVGALREVAVGIDRRVRPFAERGEPLTSTDVSDLLRVIRQARGDDAVWERFREEAAAADPEFQRRLLEKAPDVSPAELRVAALLVEGRSTLEIADTLGVTDRTVELHRSTLRKKLGLDRKAKLVESLRDLEQYTRVS